MVLNAIVDEVHLVQAMFSAIDSKNWSALETVLHPDIVYKRPGYETMSGRTAVLRYYNHERIIREGVHKNLLVIVEANKVACSGSFEGTLEDRSKVFVDFCDIYYLDRLKFIHRTTFFHVPAI